MELRYFGTSFQSFVETKEEHTVSKILRGMMLLEAFGHMLRMPHARYLAQGVYELRIRGDQEIRIFYTFFADAVYVLHVYQKKTEKTDACELAVAVHRRMLLENR